MTNKIKRSVVETPIDLEKFIQTELPYTVDFYNSRSQLHADIKSLFEHHLGSQPQYHIYDIDTEASVGIVAEMSRYYQFMLRALTRLLADEGAVHQYYQLSDKKYVDLLLEIARYTFEHHGYDSALTGRFDVAVDSTTGKVSAVYEFNGDTPCMLFESVNIQSHIAHKHGFDEENSWFLLIQPEQFCGKTVGLCCYADSIEDIVNTETLSQVVANAGGVPVMVDIGELHHDVLNKDRPFFLTDNYITPDLIYTLVPWEEMIVNGYNHFKDWRNWVNNQRFIEPAWRWFMSNKAFMAWMTHLLENDPEFETYRDLPHVPTYLENRFSDNYVIKPTIGRLSNNITIVKNGVTTVSPATLYTEAPVIYQKYVAPGTVDGANYIMGVWISTARRLVDNEASTLAIREFDHAILDCQNERFVPHRLVG